MGCCFLIAAYCRISGVEGSVIREQTSFPQVDVGEEIIPRRSADCDLERVGGIFVQALELLPEESIIAATESQELQRVYD